MNNTSFEFLPTLLVKLLPTIGTQRYWSLIKALGSPQVILNSSPGIIPFLNDSARALLRDYQRLGERSQLMQSASEIIDAVTEHQGTIIHHGSPYYPELLNTIDCPPPILYAKGNIDNLCLPQLALVGSRNPTHQGLQNTRLFSQHLAANGFTITSGLALGVDGEAHQSALKAGGKTIAVMATGIDDIYPKRHRYLAHQLIAEGGTLISEFIPYTPPRADHFPRRNRIISGLSLGVLVIEAAAKSGSLITARYALEQGREVFTIPGSIHSPQSKGCHQLIKQGATLVESSEDIVEQLTGGLAHIKASQVVSEPELELSKDQSSIMDCLKQKPMTLTELISATALSTQLLSSILVELELNGHITLTRWGYECV